MNKFGYIFLTFIVVSVTTYWHLSHERPSPGGLISPHLPVKAIRTIGDEAPPIPEVDLSPAELYQALLDRVGTNPGEGDPRISRPDFGIFTDAEIAQYDELHLIPFNRVLDMHCSEVESLEKTVGGTENKCTVTLEYPPHPYIDIEDGELREMAKFDAEAAYFLAKRQKWGSNEQVAFFLHAAALSGKSGPLIMAAQRYTLHPMRRTALETLALEMGDPRAEPEYWRSQMPDEQQEALVVELDKMRTFISIVQVTVGVLADA